MRNSAVLAVRRSVWCATEFGRAGTTRFPAAGNTLGYESDVFDLLGALRSGADDVHVRLPVDWDSVDPIPQALVELLARPGPVDVPLDDVVPGEPERAHSEVPG